MSHLLDDHEMSLNDYERKFKDNRLWACLVKDCGKTLTHEPASISQHLQLKHSASLVDYYKEFVLLKAPTKKAYPIGKRFRDVAIRKTYGKQK